MSSTPKTQIRPGPHSGHILKIYTHFEPDRPNTKFANWTDPGFFVQLIRVVGVVGFESIAEGEKSQIVLKLGV